MSPKSSAAEGPRTERPILRGVSRASDATTETGSATRLHCREPADTYDAAVADNDTVLIEQVIAQQQAERDVPLSDATAFEHFASAEALREYDVSVDEIAEGVVGGGNDGAIDAVYVFLNDVLLSEDDDLFEASFNPSRIPVGSQLTLELVQAKRETSFTETAIDKVAASTRRLLNLSEDLDDLRKLYSDAVVEKFRVFREALTRIATRHPKVKIRFTYATKGLTAGIDSKVEVKGRDLETQFRAVVTDATGSIRFLGSAELWRLHNQISSYTSELTYVENAAAPAGSVALVTLREYFSFLTDEHGALRRLIFDWNVRDYQGDVEVNREIRASLEDPNAPEFWWLNNGVTIVCSRSSITGKTYALDDVQVVNGLQTSHTIYSFLRAAPEDHPSWNRAVLVRILDVESNNEVRDRVIRATNRQTSVPAASLRATDEIQRDIEAFFHSHGWFYDRRKNFYRNVGKSPERIIGIPLLAQAVMAMGLSRPDNSRARPSSLLKRDDDYTKIFTKDVSLETYLWLARTQKAIDNFLISDVAAATAQERTNVRFHLAMLLVARRFGGKVYSPKQLGAVTAGEPPKADEISEVLAVVREALVAYVAQHGDGADKIAKGPAFVDFLLTRAFSGPAEAGSGGGA